MTHTKKLHNAGLPLKTAKKVLIMLHGRGASAQNILSLGQQLSVHDFHLVAPQATNNTWYPYSFMSPVEQNEPWLSSAIEIIKETVDEMKKAGFQSRQIYILGFSQGACLSLEFASRYALPWGGIISLTGGLIGEQLDRSLYQGDFEGTNVFIGNSDKDPHVPMSRSEESKQIMESLGARVNLQIYPGMSHTVNKDEIDRANAILGATG